MHTATTQHLIMVTVSREGDEGVEPDYLVDVLMWGLEQHNSRVQVQDDLDYNIEPLVMSASPNLMTGTMAMVLPDKDTHAELTGCEIREFDENDEIISSPTLFEF